jgi:hypothetical protein
VHPYDPTPKSSSMSCDTNTAARRSTSFGKEEQHRGSACRSRCEVVCLATCAWGGEGRSGFAEEGVDHCEVVGCKCEWG